MQHPPVFNLCFTLRMTKLILFLSGHFDILPVSNLGTIRKIKEGYGQRKRAL